MTGDALTSLPTLEFFPAKTKLKSRISEWVSSVSVSRLPLKKNHGKRKHVRDGRRFSAVVLYKHAVGDGTFPNSNTPFKVHIAMDADREGHEHFP